MRKPIFTSENFLGLGDTFKSPIPADVADLKKAFLYYIVKDSKGKCYYIMYMSRNIKIVLYYVWLSLASIQRSSSFVLYK